MLIDRYKKDKRQQDILHSQERAVALFRERPHRNIKKAQTIEKLDLHTDIKEEDEMVIATTPEIKEQFVLMLAKGKEKPPDKQADNGKRHSVKVQASGETKGEHLLDNLGNVCFHKVRAALINDDYRIFYDILREHYGKEFRLKFSCEVSLIS